MTVVGLGLSRMTERERSFGLADGWTRSSPSSLELVPSQRFSWANRAGLGSSVVWPRPEGGDRLSHANKLRRWRGPPVAQSNMKPFGSLHSNTAIAIWQFTQTQ